MSFVKQYSAVSEIREELNYHTSEADFHSEQYFSALAEAHSHLEKYKEHSGYKKQFSSMLNEVSYAVG
jgi:hypothetical protein